MEGILCFSMGLGMTIKEAYVHGLIFGRAYYRKDICVCDLGDLFGGAYYRNITVFGFS